MYNLATILIIVNSNYTLGTNKEILCNYSLDNLLNINVKSFINTLGKKYSNKMLLKKFEKELQINVNMLCLSIMVALFSLIKDTEIMAPNVDYDYGKLKILKEELQNDDTESGDKLIYKDDGYYFFDEVQLKHRFEKEDYNNPYNDKQKTSRRIHKFNYE